ncbi:ABC transporter substrate-binding protein [Rhizobium sp. L1K21]|uniref:substrate-binding periplasmic protein n=1 Tax=Rhizobium sp. L1K21 TaxID=2954933 RepID=UPI0020922152|nr:transporter substrate-binding domain-containing protein [Rhizobium sp. L1K21]MCO6185462.1 transporter substrate-binding domain-containing protein [Rhizobium sp. L1K21]
MMMKRKCKYATTFAALIGFTALCAGHSPTLAAEKIHLVTEQYAPFNYSENGVLKGLTVELVEAVMNDAGLEYDMHIMPWARAIALAENKADHCVFATVHTSERDKRFKWVEPLVTARNYLTKWTGSDVHAETIEEATQYLVGSQLGDYTVDVLKSKGFERLDITSEIDLTLNKLIKGRIDLMPMADAMLKEKQAAGIPIEPMLVLTKVINSVACNKDMSDDVIAKMQASLDRITANGTKAAIFDKYGFSHDNF